MTANFFLKYPYAILSLVALFINIPFGYIRNQYPKMSLPWLFWIHASIPLIIFLRVILKISPWFIPMTILLAVIGQVAGSRWHRKNSH